MQEIRHEQNFIRGRPARHASRNRTGCNRALTTCIAGSPNSRAVLGYGRCTEKEKNVAVVTLANKRGLLNRNCVEKLISLRLLNFPSRTAGELP
jgi:hypothetical protein